MRAERARPRGMRAERVRPRGLRAERAGRGRVDGQVAECQFSPNLASPRPDRPHRKPPLRGGAAPRRGGSLQAGPLRGHVAVGLVKSSYLGTSVEHPLSIYSIYFFSHPSTHCLRGVPSNRNVDFSSRHVVGPGGPHARNCGAPRPQGPRSNVRSPNPELREVLDQRGGGVRSV